MWQVLIPVALAAAYKGYESLKRRADDPINASGEPRRGSERPLGERVTRWIEILREGEAPTTRGSAGTDAALAPPALGQARRRPWLRPRPVTALTALALIAAVAWARAEPASLGRGLLRDVLLGALIGIGTNWVAIKMLFHPRIRRWGVQGVVPRNKDRIAAQIARGLTAHVLDPDTIREAVHDSDLVGTGLEDLLEGLARLARDPRFQDDLSELLQARIGAFVRDDRFRERFLDALARFARRVPERASGFVGFLGKDIGDFLEKQVYAHRDQILDSLDEQVPHLVVEATQRLAGYVESIPGRMRTHRDVLEEAVTDFVAQRIARFDVEGLVQRRLEAFSVEELEQLILDATDRELTTLQLLGWVIGAGASLTVSLLVHAWSGSG